MWRQAQKWAREKAAEKLLKKQHGGQAQLLGGAGGDATREGGRARDNSGEGRQPDRGTQGAADRGCGGPAGGSAATAAAVDAAAS